MNKKILFRKICNIIILKSYFKMAKILKTIELVKDKKTVKKAKHKLFAIMKIVMFAKLANADTWEEIEIFAKSN